MVQLPGTKRHITSNFQVVFFFYKKNIKLTHFTILLFILFSNDINDKFVFSFFSFFLKAKPYMVFPLTPKFVDIESQLTWFCQSRAKPLPTYTWFKDGLQINSTQDVIVVNNTLQITNVNREHAGMYQCSATNIHGTTYSSAQLSVLGNIKKNLILFKI